MRRPALTAMRLLACTVGAQDTVHLLKTLATRHTLGALPDVVRGVVCARPSTRPGAVACFDFKYSSCCDAVVDVKDEPSTKQRWRRALRKISFKNAVVRGCWQVNFRDLRLVVTCESCLCWVCP